MDRPHQAARGALGRLARLGHHYQRDEVIKFADFTPADSTRLAGEIKPPPRRRSSSCSAASTIGRKRRRAERRPPAGHTCPDSAGCSMADMAAEDQLALCWTDPSRCSASASGIIRSLYQLRRVDPAFCGEHASGVVCAPRRMPRRRRKWRVGARREDRVPARPAPPDESHRLQARRAARRRWWCWDPKDRIWERPRAGTPLEARPHDSVEGSLLGACPLHGPSDRTVRARHPGVRVIVHPRSRNGTSSRLPTSTGSTASSRTVGKACRVDLGGRHGNPSRINRLARGVEPRRAPLARPVRLHLLDDVPRLAESPALGARGARPEGQVHNRIRRAGRPKHWTKVALDRMLSIS